MGTRRFGGPWALLLWTTFACSSGNDDPRLTDGGADAGPSDVGNGDPQVLVGTFQVRLVAPVEASPGVDPSPGFTTVFGKVYDGPTPATLIWQEVSRSGECILLTPRVPFCNSPCGGSAACVEDDLCQPYPSARSVGLVTVTGLASTGGPIDLELRPVANNYQNPANVELDYPAFSEGQVIGLSAAGDVLPGFSVSAPGVGPLTLSDAELRLVAGQALDLSWNTPDDPSLAKILVKLDISHHGGTKGKIECEAVDDGALEIPGPMIGQLLALGVAGFPTVIATRRSLGSTSIAVGRIDLLISADDERPVIIDGLISCTEDGDCSNGATCQPDLSCR
jgi:hypothetical protein